MAITSLPDVERRLRDVRSVALGGMLLENRPSTLVRALLRAGATGLFLCSAPAASWDADVLLGAGRIATVRIPHISLASLGLAPAARRAAAAGTVVFEDCDEALLLGGYLAASHNVPIQVLHNLVVVNDLGRDAARRVVDERPGDAASLDLEDPRQGVGIGDDVVLAARLRGDVLQRRAPRGADGIRASFVRVAQMIPGARPVLAR